MRYPGPVTHDPNAVHYVFSGNWSAVVGVGICIALLIAWWNVRFAPEAEEDA